MLVSPDNHHCYYPHYRSEDTESLRGPAAVRPELNHSFVPAPPKTVVRLDLHLRLPGYFTFTATVRHI